jgi:tetratricopeptide (TPR) repeat protein
MKKSLCAACVAAVVGAASLCYSQNATYTESERAGLLARSDSLFAAGVDLYNAGRYAEAIPLFTESDKIDKAVLDSISNRRDYSSMWLASCYYKLKDSATAESINSDYMVEPVDRRISVISDSLAQIGLKCMIDNNIVDAIKYFSASAQIDYANFGENVKYANTLYVLSGLYLSLSSNTDVIRIELQCATDAARIISSIYGENSLQYEATLKILANSYALLGDYQKAKDLTITACEIDKKKTQ